MWKQINGLVAINLERYQVIVQDTSPNGEHFIGYYMTEADWQKDIQSHYAHKGDSIIEYFDNIQDRNMAFDIIMSNLEALD